MHDGSFVIPSIGPIAIAKMSKEKIKAIISFVFSFFSAFSFSKSLFPEGSDALKPRLFMAEIICLWVSLSESNVIAAASPARLTETDWTEGSFPILTSMLLAQEAQCIPLILKTVWVIFIKTPRLNNLRYIVNNTYKQKERAVAMNLSGTETLVNLARSFAGEAQARNRYHFYAEKLRKEGHEALYRTVTEIENNELAHAKMFLNYLADNPGFGFDNINIDVGYPYILGTLTVNLDAAASGENDEANIIYPKFSEIARKEGFI